MPEIEIIEVHTDSGSFYVVNHPFDLSLLDCGHIDGKFTEREDAERAAASVQTAVSGADD